MTVHSNAYRPEIDGLRAVAILLVIIFHSGFGWIDGGFVGVDVFFVISGYLIGGLLLSEHSRSGRLSLREFWSRRARRLLPLSSLVIVTTVILGMIVSSPVARQQISTDATSAALYVSNWTFARQAIAYSDRTVNDGLFTQFWSLSIEEQFYLLLPMVFVAVLWSSRRSPARFVRRIFGAVSILVAVSFAASIWSAGARSSSAYFLTYARLWELGVGVLVAIWFQRRPVQLTKRTDLLVLAGLAIIIGSALTFDESTAYPGWRAAVPVAGTTLVIVCAARTTSILHRILSTRVLVVLGLWSYGWYLWHWPAIAIASLAAQRWFPSYDNDLLIVAAILGSLLLAAITHALVENPIRYWRVLANFPTRSLALGIALTAIAALIGPLALTRIDNGSRPVTAGGRSAMSPAEAKADGPRFDGVRECFAPTEVSEVGSECIFGDPDGDITVALIGDSHAFHWSPALQQAAIERNWRVIIHGKASCPMVPVPVSIQSDTDSSKSRRYDECDAWRSNVLDDLRGRGPLDAVIVSSYYDALRRVLDPDGSRASAEDSSSRWSEQSRVLYEQLVEISRVVIRLGDTPTPTGDVPECLSENTSSPDSCAVDVARRARLDASLLALERSTAPVGVTFSDLTDAVCPLDPCPVVDGEGGIKFRDRTHLTATYSRSLSDDFAKMVEAALGRSGAQ